LDDTGKYDHYYPLDNLGEIDKLIDWDNFYIRGMIYMKLNETVLLNETDADMIPEAWSSILSVIVDLINEGKGIEISYDQGFCLSMKKINNLTIEICNEGGNGHPKIYVYGNPKELLPPIFDAIQECCEIMSKYIKMDNLKQQLQIVKNKADDWMKSFN
jgi:hypothetical protein